MNMLPSFLKPSPDHIDAPLDLDPDFEEACRKEVQGLFSLPMQTDEERTIEAMENLVTLYTDKGNAIDGEIAALEIQLSDKKAQKIANARILSWARTAVAGLKNDPSAQPSKAKSRSRKAEKVEA